MRKYNDDSEEDFSYEDANEIIQQEKMFHREHMEMEEKFLRSKLLYRTICISEKSFFWKFFSSERKMKIIENNFERILKLIEE